MGEQHFIFTDELVSVATVDDGWVADGGKMITHIAATLKAYGVDVGAAKAYVPQVIHGSVASAPSGGVQDPAGSAVGTKGFAAGGGSGAIYKHFNELPNAIDHLAFIPQMAPGQSVQNDSQGDGGRVIHTFSPMLGGSPDTDVNRGRQLSAIANGYATAMQAFNAADGSVGDVLNLVPISAVIFAGKFASFRETYPASGHLHPSYSLTAVLLAADALGKAGADVPKMTIYYFDRGPAADANAITMAF